MSRLSTFLRDARGLTALETAVLAPVLFTAVLSSFDAGLYVWRWNQAVEAARIGVRLAAVSDPVSSELDDMTGLETGVEAGQPVGAYERVCSGETATCSGGTYDAAAMARIFYGASGQTCAEGTRRSERGMCDALPILNPSAVTVTYRASGVDTAGVPGALRPLVTVRISGAVPRMVLFDKILPATLPATEMTMLAEDLRSSG